MRDWPHEDYTCGFDGGKEYWLKEVLQSKTISENVKSVLNSIEESFESTKCFLMRNPGDKIANRKADAPAPTLKGQCVRVILIKIIRFFYKLKKIKFTAKISSTKIFLLKNVWIFQYPWVLNQVFYGTYIQISFAFNYFKVSFSNQNIVFN